MTNFFIKLTLHKKIYKICLQIAVVVLYVSLSAQMPLC